MENNYIRVNIEEYIYNGINNGTLIPVEAIKTARITARQGNVSERIITWSVDDEGREIVEKEAQVTLDNITHRPGWVVSKVSINGELLIDQNGHANEWIISDSVFTQKYEVDPNNPLLYKPRIDRQIFVQIPDNIILVQFGEEMKISSGGYINITNHNDMYGVSQRDFDDTYKLASDTEEKDFSL